MCVCVCVCVCDDDERGVEEGWGCVMMFTKEMDWDLVGIEGEGSIMLVIFFDWLPWIWRICLRFALWRPALDIPSGYLGGFLGGL